MYIIQNSFKIFNFYIIVLTFFCCEIIVDCCNFFIKIFFLFVRKKTASCLSFKLVSQVVHPV